MSKFCPFCGEELVDNAKFCKNCGKSLENFQNVHDDGGDEFQFNPPVVEKSHNLAFAIGIIAAIFFPLIGIIIGLYLYTRKDSSNAKRNGAITIALGVIVWIVSALMTFMYMG